MVAHDREKCCVILLAMGGPAITDDIPEFLYNIFSDRAIIRLPGGRLLQKPFARLISKARSGKVKDHYSLIGGGSPLLKWTEAQKGHIEFTLSPVLPGLRCYTGMRYFHPRTPEVVTLAYQEGFRRFVFLPMYPQYCKATTGSSFQDAEDSLKQYPDVDAVFIDDFHEDDGYISLLRKYIDSHISPGETVLFSAHSIPQKFVEEGDPYVDQVNRTAQLVAGDRSYLLSFQSRTGPVTWVGPDTVKETGRLLGETDGGLFVVPISFVCDHVETLYELDIELQETVDKLHRGRIRRMPMFNDDPEFGRVLSEIILESLREHET